MRLRSSVWAGFVGMIMLGIAISCGGGGGGSGDANSTPIAPTITQEPSSTSVTLGQAATFNVTATGTPSPTYQWRRNGSAIPGGTSSSYQTPTTTRADDGSIFSVLVSNGTGSVTSQGGSLAVNWAPTITTQPGNQEITAGQAATFSVVADANPAASFQWQRNGQNILGATSASYTTPTTSLSDTNANFILVASNLVGSQTSNPATLTVVPAPVPPSITTQPQPATVQVGQSVSYTIVASGTAPLSYQWRKGGIPIALGGTNSTYTIGAAQNSDVGNYDVVVNNPTNQPVTSDAVTLSVIPATTFLLSVELHPGVTGTPLSSITYSPGTAVDYNYSTVGYYTNLTVTLDGNIVPSFGRITMNSSHTLTVTAVNSLAPVIAGFYPTSGTGNTWVDITGANFSTANSVAFNGIFCSNWHPVDDNHIRAQVPVNATTGSISIINCCGALYYTEYFTVTIPPAPQYIGINPSAGAIGALINISGMYLTATSKVTFNGIQSQFTIINDNIITATVPSGTSSGPVVVTTTGGTAVGPTFTVLPTPKITSVIPSTGSVGDSINISGSHFTGTTKVTFGAPAIFTVINDNLITAIVPTGASTGPVSVTTTGWPGQSPVTFFVKGGLN